MGGGIARKPQKWTDMVVHSPRVLFRKRWLKCHWLYSPGVEVSVRFCVGLIASVSIGAVVEEGMEVAGVSVCKGVGLIGEGVVEGTGVSRGGANVGLTEAGAVAVGISGSFGTYNVCPVMILVEVKQLAC